MSVDRLPNSVFKAMEGFCASSCTMRPDLDAGEFPCPAQIIDAHLPAHREPAPDDIASDEMLLTAAAMLPTCVKIVREHRVDPIDTRNHLPRSE